MLRCWITLASTLLYFRGDGGVCALRGLRLEVPEAVRTGDSARLACNYDLEDAQLYSIKWYRQDEEFYRFLPKESPPSRVFPMTGVHVDVSRSDDRLVTLLNVDRRSAGQFKCEVSADAPLFHTGIQSALLRVVDVPVGEPELRSERARFVSGEQVRANCTAPPSLPPANLTWFVDGQQVTDRDEVETAYRVEGAGSLERPVSVLRLEAGGGTKLRLRCEATMYHLYRGIAELELWQDAPRPASVQSGPSPSAGVSGLRRYEGVSAVLLTLCLLLTATR